MRNAIPTSELKLHGNFRKARHANRADTLPLAGEPVKPDGMTEPAAKLWQQVVDAYKGRNVLAEVDTAALAMLCDMQTLYLAALAEAKQNPTDKVIRVAVVSYGVAVERLMTKFGMTPSSRASMKTPPANAANELSEFARKRG